MNGLFDMHMDGLWRYFGILGTGLLGRVNFGRASEKFI